MYYKITNKDSDIFKKLEEMMLFEQRIEKDNKAKVEERVELDFDKYLATGRQSNFRRTTSYEGFEFKEPEKVDSKIWKQDSEYKNCFTPNRRTKKGREMAKFLSEGLEESSLFKLFDLLEIEQFGRFKIPFCDLIEGKIILFLDPNHVPEDENVIEITSKEFNKLVSKTYRIKP